MTYNILQIDSSPRGETSLSRKLTAKAVTGLKAKHPDATVTVRDFGAEALPHLTATVIGAYYTPSDKLTDLQAEAVKKSDDAIAEVMAADAIVIGVPMWNFGIPSSLKAWIDHIVRVGKTFAYGASGPQGLIPAGKKVIVVVASGGVYSSGPMSVLEHQERYLKSVLDFIGLKDLTFVRAEGVSMGPDAIQLAMSTAEAQIADILKKAA